MDKGLEKKLYDRYPKLFMQKDLSIQESCMPWGICTDDGWYWLIDNLCNCIQSYIDANKKPQVEVVQVKEKFGELRFYTNGADDLVHGMIWLAGDLSYKICESCGSTKDIIHTNGWVQTLCKDCFSKCKSDK